MNQTDESRPLMVLWTVTSTGSVLDYHVCSKEWDDADRQNILGEVEQAHIIDRNCVSAATCCEGQIAILEKTNRPRDQRTTICRLAAYLRGDGPLGPLGFEFAQ